MEKHRKLLRKMGRKAKRTIFRLMHKMPVGGRATVLVAAVILCAFGVSGVSGESKDRLAEMTEPHTETDKTEKMVVENETETETETETEELQAGLKGMMHSALTIDQYSDAAEKIKLTGENENVLVGAEKVSRQEAVRQVLEDGTQTAGNVTACARALVRENQMPSSEYYTLLQIVEAEATGEDLQGKMLIANVILNRVRDKRFPDTIEEVVWQQIGGNAQFQPTIDGRIYSVEVSKDTIEAVDRVLAGEDASQGALYFMARNASESASVGWFDNTLELLFQHGGHEYYTLAEGVRVS